MKNDSEFLKAYRKKMTKAMIAMNPTWDKEQVKEIVKETVEKRFQNPSVIIDNNYTNERKETTLISIFDWAIKRKPIIAGNGTFYKNQDEALNPVAAMLDQILADRNAYKKEMFKVEDTESHAYKDKDLAQQNEKKNANSYYGASGAPASAFYSKWSGPATTLSAQSVISTTETLFESLLADNYSFLNLTECIEWIEVARTTFVNGDEELYLDDWIMRHSVLELRDRLCEDIIRQSPRDEELLLKYLESLEEDEITYLYYKNNLMQFFKDHQIIRDLMETIFMDVHNLDYVDKKDEDWLLKIPSEFVEEFRGKEQRDWNNFVNKTYFMDPNDPPTEIKETLATLCDYIMKYVYCRYLSVDRIYRLRNFTRRTVTVIDTDSNIISLDILMRYIMGEILKESSYGRDFQHNKFIAINTFAYVITTAVTDILLHYGKMSNIPERFRPRYNMKNEFFFDLLVIGKAKKRYISKVLLREGNMMNPPKSDIKGFDFKKATTSEEAEKVFMGIINRRILYSEEIDMMGAVRDLRAFQTDIRESLARGENKYLPIGNAKELAAYKDPASEQGVRGAISWNLLYPDHMIEFPAKICILKLNLFKPEDCEKIKEVDEEIYDVIMDKIFNDTTGMFVSKTWESDLVVAVNVKDKKWFEKIPKKYRAKYKKLGPVAWNEFADKYNKPQVDGHYEIKSRGLQVLGIPMESKIPEWVQPYIDTTTVVNNIISPFRSVLEIFGSKFVDEGRQINGVNRKTGALTNIVKF